MFDQPIDNENVEYVAIKVTAGVIIKIGAGIYSSVAGALKELISNSYDADASTVVISTGYPNFNQIKVVDNGSGMTLSRFKIAITNIGSSLKGVLEDTSSTNEFHRPMIGHLGIGLMALSQVCDEAIIESQVKGSTTKFVARLDFSEFKGRETHQERVAHLEILKEKYKDYTNIDSMIDKEKSKSGKRDLQETKKLISDIEKALAEETKDSENEVDDEHLGYCAIFPDLPAILGEYGTTITLNKIDKGVINLLRDIDRPSDVLPKSHREKEAAWETYRDEINSLDWHELCERLRTGKNQLTYQRLPQYHRFLWELSMMTPVTYFEDGPIKIDQKILKAKKKEINSFNFTLNVDNKILHKPVLLPSGNLDVADDDLENLLDYYIEPLTFEETVANDLLKCSGYIYWQRKQIIPSSIRGVQIYIRNVGIGLYDPNLMKFATVNPTSRAGQISAEIYAESGLERALNVDRNSFRETDPHYLALQQYLWRVLGSTSQTDGVLGKSVASYFSRKEKEEDEREVEHRQELINLVRSKSKDIRVRFSSKKSTEPYVVDGKTITVFNNSPLWPKSKSEKFTAQTLLITIKSALASGYSSKHLVELIEELLLNRK